GPGMNTCSVLTPGATAKSANSSRTSTTPLATTGSCSVGVSSRLERSYQTPPPVALVSLRLTPVPSPVRTRIVTVPAAGVGMNRFDLTRMTAIGVEKVMLMYCLPATAGTSRDHQYEKLFCDVPSRLSTASEGVQSPTPSFEA